MIDSDIQSGVRFAFPGDSPRLCELDQSVRKQNIQRLIAQQQYFVAEVDDQIAGLIRLEYIWTTQPYIGLIWIMPDHRRRGLGTALLRHLCEYLHRQGHKQLFSSSQANEPEPQAWHRHVGFADSGCVKGINTDGIDEVVFRLDIGCYLQQVT